MASIAFKFIKPRRDYRAMGQKVARQLEAQLERDVEGIRQDFEATTATWEHQVEFQTRTLTAAGSRVAYVYTDDEIYKFVDKGTQPHVIMAKHRMRPLTFQKGYKAKTQPQVIGSRAGGPFGDTVRALVVHHPGTEARQFSETIQKKWEKDIPRAMADVIRNAVISS